jgi:zinc protease
MPLTQFRLANGLTLYVIENHSAPVFTLQTWFNVGSRDEKLDPRLNCTGLAHFFEHMMFRGTRTRPDGQFDEIMTRNGMQDGNATTWLDRTNYYQSLPASKLELALELESDRMAHLAIDHNLLETERSAVLGEYRMGLDDPTTIAYEHLYATAFEKHPYRFTTIGTEAEIEKFSVDDANYFYRKYYAPNNASIILAGDVEPAVAASLVEKYYGAFPAQAIERAPAPLEPEQKAPRKMEFEHSQLIETKLLLAYHTPPARHPDQAALWVLESALSTGQGSWLQQIWVDSGIAVSASGGLDQFQDPGLLVLSADIQEGRTPDEAIAAVDRCLDGMEKRDLEFELERARNQLLLMLLGPLSENDGVASFMGEYISAAGEPLYAFEQLAELDSVTVGDLRRVARQYLTASNRTVVVGKPAAEAPDASEEASS